MIRRDESVEATMEEKYGNKVKKDSFCETPVSKGKVNFPDSLVGRAKINFDMYSGYVGISNAPDYLFYWFFTSQDNNADAPLIIWTNGMQTYLIPLVLYCTILFPLSSLAS